MFGMMGAGKSTFSNTLLNKPGHFKEGDDADTVTSSIQVASVNMPGGGKLNVFDVPGLGDPDVEKLAYAKQFLADLKKEMVGRNLKTVILVKKATDFRVGGEFAWYTIVLKTIMDADGFDMSKVMLAVTFSDQRTVDDT